jgi:hypothetical protein
MRLYIAYFVIEIRKSIVVIGIRESKVVFVVRILVCGAPMKVVMELSQPIALFAAYGIII